MLTEQQLSERLDYVCGSDAGVIAGYSSFKTPVELWAEKTGRWTPPDISDKPHVKAGNMLEPTLIKWFEEETGLEVETDERLIKSDIYKFAAANIDGRIRQDNAIVEVKTTSSNQGWGDGGSNEIPAVYYCQVQHYLAVTGAERAYVVVLIRGSDFRIYIVEREQAFIDRLMQIEQEFWQEHVLKDIAPEAIQVSDLLQLKPRLERESIEANENVIDQLRRLSLLEEQAKQIKQEADSIKSALILSMKDESQFVDMHERVLATCARVKTKRFDSARFKKEQPDLYAEFVKESESIRFTPKKVDWSEYV